MEIILLGNKTIHKLKLPSKIEGSFFLKEPITNENLLNIDAIDNNWVLFSNEDTKIRDVNGNFITDSKIRNADIYLINNNNKQNVIYCSDTFDDTVKLYKVNNGE